MQFLIKYFGPSLKSLLGILRFNHVLFRLFIVVFLGGSFKLIAGNPKIDSLSLKLESISEDNTEKVNILNLIGYEYWIIDAKKSVTYGEQALQLSNKLAYPIGKAKANRIIGVAYWAQGNLTSSLKFLNTSHKIYKSIENKKGMANTWLNIGMVYADLMQYKNALEHYEKAINAFTALGLKSRIATTFTKTGTIYIEQEKFKEAKEYLTNALQMHNAASFTYGMAEAHNRLGILYLKKNEIEQASYHIKRSINLGKKVNDFNGLTNNLILYGKILRHSGNLNEAAIKLSKGLELSLEYNLKKYELLAYKELKELKKQQNKLVEAFEYYDQFMRLKDSLFNSEKVQQIAYLEFETKLKIRDQQLEVLRAQEKKDNLIKLILLLSVCIISICGYVIYRISRQRTKKTRLLNLKNQELLESAHLLTQKDLENAKLKEKELRQQLDFKTKELTSYTLNFIKKNEVIQQLKLTIRKLKEGDAINKEQLVADLTKITKKNLSIDKDWEDFSRFFEDAHQGFYTNLKCKHHDLSSNDLKICSLIRLNMNIKETAGILGISPESVKTARYRLRKKLKLAPDQEISSYLIQLENDKPN